MTDHEASDKALQQKALHPVRRWSLLPLFVLCLGPGVAAQDDRTVQVDGRPMRVRTDGPGGGGRPVVVFESGAGTGLNAWSSVLPEVFAFATVVAYDRAGIGGSEADGQPPTAAHVARKLDALLRTVGVRPPYVLVGHSWGGALIRMFAALYPEKVAGLVYVDPSDPRSREQNLAYLEASGYSADGAREFLARNLERMSRFVSAQTGSYRAEMEVIQAVELTHFAEFRALPALPAIPIALLVANRLEPQMWAGRPCVPAACRDAWMRQRLQALELFAPPGPASTVTVSDESGHVMQDDQPSLVIAAVRNVLSGQRPAR